MKIRQVGEFSIVERIIQRAGAGKRSSSLYVPPGDDAFAAAIPRGELIVATKDLLIENIHFSCLWATPEQIGYKSMAVNLSDLAAMGACRPLYALIGLGMPGSAPVSFVDGFYKGMRALSDRYGLTIAGGDTVSTRKDIVISVSLIGSARKKHIVRRSGAKPGDILCVSGTFGDSGGGLQVLRHRTKAVSLDEKYLVRKHLLPRPRLELAATLAKRLFATSMIDSSDGLAASVRFICEQSKAGAKVYLERLPLSRQLRSVAARSGWFDPVECCLNGGEDYELVFTVKPKDLAAVQRLAPDVTAVGEITAPQEVNYYHHGIIKKIKKTGFEHFKG